MICSDARRRSLRDRGLLSVVSQLAWQTDLDGSQNQSQSLPGITRRQLDSFVAHDYSVSAVRECEVQVESHGDERPMSGGVLRGSSETDDVMRYVDRH